MRAMADETSVSNFVALSYVVDSANLMVTAPRARTRHERLNAPTRRDGSH